jgi:PKHD-type hydroxylase
MLLHLPDILTPDEIQQAQALLSTAPWGDGRKGAGEQARRVKNNEQLDHDCDAAKAIRAVVLRALDRSPLFFSAALPKRVYPPRLNRYGGDSNYYGNHIDGAVRYLPDTGQRVRTDVSCTIFLSDPESYDGGELCIADTYGEQAVKLPAGHMVLYPGTSLHQVKPVTRGYRLACFFWIESMVRSDEQRRLLFDMDQHLMRLRISVGEADPAVIGLTGTYHNLLRLWADT